LTGIRHRAILRAMHPDTALAHFKTRDAIADAAAVSRQAVHQWFEAGLVPRRSALLLERASAGACRVDPAMYGPLADSDKRGSNGAAGTR